MRVCRVSWLGIVGERQLLGVKEEHNWSPLNLPQSLGWKAKLVLAVFSASRYNWLGLNFQQLLQQKKTGGQQMASFPQSSWTRLCFLHWKIHYALRHKKSIIPLNLHNSDIFGVLRNVFHLYQSWWRNNAAVLLPALFFLRHFFLFIQFKKKDNTINCLKMKHTKDTILGFCLHNLWEQWALFIGGW